MCNRATLDHDITETLKAFQLMEKKNDLAGTLSGGQKRKLSVAIALIGGSKVSNSCNLDKMYIFVNIHKAKHFWSRDTNICQFG